ncbi:MAG: hypothetical protein EA360_10690 [Balneolaceae bacterium]|nr:MAG: hypothetical protein EA360_10690 [Balneolaceae bacterium]
MSTSKNFTDREKAEIVEKALSGGDPEIRKIAENYQVPAEEIRRWIQESKSESVETFSLDVSEEFADSVEFGATHDRLNYNKLTFWSLFGTGAIIIFIVAVMFMHEYTRTASLQTSSEQSIYFDIRELQRNDLQRLNSFGVVDPDEGIYRIPIDSAITLIVSE